MTTIARIEITLELTEGDIEHGVTTSDLAGRPLDLTQALGMLRMAEDSLLHGPDQEDDQ